MTAKTKTQRSAWAVMWPMLLVTGIEAVLVALNSFPLPDFVLPFVPLVVGLLRFWRVTVTTTSLDLTGYPDDLQAEVRKMLSEAEARWVRARSTPLVKWQDLPAD